MLIKRKEGEPPPSFSLFGKRIGKMKRFFCSMLLLCGFLTWGCGIRQSEKAEMDEIKPEAVVLAGYRHLAPGVKDAYYCSKILGVWEPLITRDAENKPKGCLATGWQMRQDGREWIFTLRQGVYFHNGSPFNADAVLKNFHRMGKGYRRSVFYGYELKSYYPSLIKCEKLDDYTIRLLFAEPSVNELYKMMDFGSAMFAPECLAENGDFNGIAIGTGPYKIAENQLNKFVRLARNENYYGEKAHIPEITVRAIPNADARYAALKSGEIMGVLDINAMPPFLAQELKKDGRFGISSNKSSMIRFLHLNGGKFPFHDARMRKAVSLAIDRRDLAQALYLNYACPTSNLINYTSPYYKEFPVEYDPDKAKKLAREVLKGKRCKIDYCINGSEPLQKGEAELIAYWLSDIGLDVTIHSLEFATMSKIMRKGEYHIARSQNGLPNGDPYNIFYTFMMPAGGRNVSSASKYYNEEVVELMEQAPYVVDEGERRRIYDRLQEISVEEQPTAPLFNDKNIVAFNKKLKNYQALIYGVDLSKVELVQ